MRKFLAVVLAIIMGLSLVACAKEDDIVRVAGLKGPTSIGMTYLMDQNEQEKTENRYEFTLAGSADEVTPKIIKGELDIAAVPANLGSVLYNKTNGNVKLLAINTLGVLYILSRDEKINSIKDLKGKTIVGSGKGSTPQYVLEYLLKENGLVLGEDVVIDWKSEHTEVAKTLLSDESAVALLPQPFVTSVRNQDDKIGFCVDLNEEWEKVTGDKLITGVLVVRKDFADNNKEKLDTFLNEYAKSVEFVNVDIDKSAELTEKYGIFKKEVAQSAIPLCNIVCITGLNMKTSMQKYLEVLYNADPKSVGGKLPDDNYYIE